jgi:hypothetical protein
MGLNVPLSGSCSLLLATRLWRRLVDVGRVEWGVGRALVAKLREVSQVRETLACEGAEGGRAVVWLAGHGGGDVQRGDAGAAEVWFERRSGRPSVLVGGLTVADATVRITKQPLWCSDSAARAVQSDDFERRTSTAMRASWAVSR